MTHLRIGTRGSPLALKQAEEVRMRLLQSHPHLETIELVPIKTTGDSLLNQNLADVGGKGLFIKEIEEALLEKRVDIAVHSMKDVPAFIPEALTIACLPEREDPRDAFISLKYASLESLPEGAIVGTSSTRRQAQLLLRRPDLTIIPFRGNVQTRLKKLEDGMADATLLAVAGLNRLHMADHITTIFPANVMLPAVAQGAIGIECRKDDTSILELLAPLHHETTGICVLAERAFLTELDGNCKTPLAAFAEMDAGTLTLSTLVASSDGKQFYVAKRVGTPKEAAQMGSDAGKETKQNVTFLEWVTS